MKKHIKGEIKVQFYIYPQAKVFYGNFDFFKFRSMFDLYKQDHDIPLVKYDPYSMPRKISYLRKPNINLNDEKDYIPVFWTSTINSDGTTDWI